MFTENDTFRRLSRCSYREAWNEVTKMVTSGSSSDVNLPYDSKLIDALHSVGWTELELKEKHRDELLNIDPGVVKYGWWPEFINLIEKLKNERR